MEKLKVPDGTKLVSDLYAMLLRQRLYDAPLGAIPAVLRMHRSGAFAAVPVPGTPLGIYLRSCRTHLRHRLAVTVKSAAWYRRQG